MANCEAGARARRTSSGDVERGILPGPMPTRSLPPGPREGHFRAHARRAVRLEVVLQLGRTASRRRAAVVDISLAGAGLELDEALVPGERLAVEVQTPTLWDPLVIPAVVAWTRLTGAARARAGVRFDHEGPASVFATWEMLDALVYD